MKVNFNVHNMTMAMLQAGLPMGELKTPKSIDKLATAGGGHSNFLKGCVVTGGLRCTQTMLLQLERYQFFNIVSCESKMHTLTKMDLDEQFSNEVFISVRENFKAYVYEFEQGRISFESLVANCPMGLELTLGFATNYMCLMNIYKQRKNHKLLEWRLFCEEVEKLPKMDKWLK